MLQNKSNQKYKKTNKMTKAHYYKCKQKNEYWKYTNKSE